MTRAIRAAHPGLAVVVTRDFKNGIFAFPGATVTPLPKTEILSHTVFSPPEHRGDLGRILKQIQYGEFSVKWGAHTFLMYLIEFQEEFSRWQQYFLVHEDEDTILKFLQSSFEFNNELHEEILVFAHGYWNKDHDLWVDVQKADWNDVILADKFKTQLQDDIHGFFSSEKIYKDLAIPWKRGIIFLGPPGNGKTISLKAVMKTSPHPVLYVKNFTSFMGDEMSMQQVFNQARSVAPCVLILEDLDSLITDANRSFFLNELDGMKGNDGILLIGTTNYFSKLDPSISKRPSRFDRKFEFLAPNHDERVLYAKYWQKKLESNEAISFPDSLLQKIADWTDKFSFAYMKEAMVSTLVLLATKHGVFEEVLKHQIEELKKSINSGEEEQ